LSDILSVGIDIGTSTTQLVFSRISMENTSGYFTVPKISIVDKEVIYKSDVYITPLATQVLINGDAVR
jgi:ethanolamine utilization protein EutA